MSKPSVSLIDISTYLPGEPIGADYYAQFAESDELRDNVMFRAPKFRHHVAPDESSIDMIECAVQGLIERHGHDVIEGADVLITHTQAPEPRGTEAPELRRTKQRRYRRAGTAHPPSGPDSPQREKNAHEATAALGPRGSEYRAEARSAEPPDQ